jgi:hypothetical protein
VSVAHACNPSYSGGRDQEDHSSKPANSLQDPTLTKPITKKRAGRVAQGIDPEFKHQYCKKKKKKNLHFKKNLIRLSFFTDDIISI